MLPLELQDRIFLETNDFLTICRSKNKYAKKEFLKRMNNKLQFYFDRKFITLKLGIWTEIYYLIVKLKNNNFYGITYGSNYNNNRYKYFYFVELKQAKKYLSFNDILIYNRNHYHN